MCAAELEELHRREKEAGITPEPSLDAFMRAISVQARLPCRRFRARLRLSTCPGLLQWTFSIYH